MTDAICRNTIALFCLASLVCAAQQPFTWEDDFSAHAEGSAARPAWEADAIGWTVEKGQFRGSWMSSSAAFTTQQQLYPRVAASAHVRPLEAQGKSWKIAALMLHQDDRNFWHLGLVESPDDADKRHFVELCEMRNGKWLSQSNLKQTAHENTGLDWQYGTTYVLRVELTPERIEGTVSDLQGNVLTRIAFAFTGEAVKLGRPALRVSVMDAVFDDFEMQADTTGARPIPAVEKKTLPAYAVPGSGVAASVAASGFFQTENADGRWWLVDPNGERFYAVGTDHVNYYSHWCQDLGYAPYNRNCEKKYGSIHKWAETATQRLRDWGFNLLGAGNLPEVRYKGLAHTIFASFGSTFSGHSALVEKVHWTGFPNVFHPKWEAFCRGRAKSTCANNRNDPWLLGYFLDNELEWYGKTHREDGIFTAAMKWPADHTGKRALVALLKTHHGTLAEFNRVWQQKATDWDELLKMTELLAPSDEAHAAQRVFLELVADRYFAVTTQAIREFDRNHLVIGSRFAGNAPEWAWKACAKYCDVVTFNHYPRIDFESGDLSSLGEHFAGYYETVQRPMMITEWSFPALDSGLPCKHGAGMRVDTQQQKARCFELMQHLLFRLPFMVGSDYFMWADEPVLGISDTFPEDSNYGLVNVDDKPYKELTDACRRLNPLAARIHAGTIPEVYLRDVKLSEAGVRLVLENWAATSATVNARVRLGRSEATGSVQVRATQAGVAAVTEMEIPLAVPQGVHALEAEIVSEPDSPFGCRGQRRLTRAVTVGTGTEVDPPARAILIHNPTNDALNGLPILLRGAEGAKANVCYFTPVQKPDVALPLQWLGQQEATLVVPELAAGRSLSGTWQAAVPEARTVCELRSITVRRTESGGFVIDNGMLRLEHGGKSGNVIDRVLLTGTELGSYNPLIWQCPRDNQWTPATRLESVDIRQGPVAVVLDVVAAGGPGAATITAVDDDGVQATQRGRATAFRSAHRIVVWPDTPYFAARLLRIENVDRSQPLNLNGYFFFLRSTIGGDVKGDTSNGPGGVPNYYRSVRQVNWYDADVGARYGCAPGDTSTGFRLNFWLDSAGGQHPDARVELDPPIVLAPGEKYEPGNAPYLLIYGATDTTGGPASWPEVEKTLSARMKLLVQGVNQ